MNDPKHIPRSYCYWVVPGKLLAGNYPGSRNPEEMNRKLTTLLDDGIRRFVNLQEEDERDFLGDRFVPYASAYNRLASARGIQTSMVRMPIRDMDVPSYAEMQAILNEIDRSISLDQPVYVHCWGGKGRTGTVVGCYLARHGIAAGWDALRKINSLRRGVADWRANSPQTPEQFAMVRRWQMGE
jgi:protein tyrosine/serine phosphatase